MACQYPSKHFYSQSRCVPFWIRHWVAHLVRPWLLEGYRWRRRLKVHPVSPPTALYSAFFEFACWRRRWWDRQSPGLGSIFRRSLGAWNFDFGHLRELGEETGSASSSPFLGPLAKSRAASIRSHGGNLLSPRPSGPEKLRHLAQYLRSRLRRDVVGRSCPRAGWARHLSWGTSRSPCISRCGDSFGSFGKVFVSIWEDFRRCAKLWACFVSCSSPWVCCRLLPSCWERACSSA